MSEGKNKGRLEVQPQTESEDMSKDKSDDNKSAENNILPIEADRALFEGQVPGLALTFYRNERPPCGLLGLLDWHFHGEISQFIRKGTVTGQIGECSYLPFQRNKMTFHLILAGSGDSPRPGERNPVPLVTIQTLQKNLLSLKLPKLAISRTDFGNVESDYFEKHLKGVSLWIAP